MALIVEDGTGVEGADSYADLPAIEDYIASYVLDASAWNGLPDDSAKEKLVRVGTQFFDRRFQLRVMSRPASSGQGLLFPLCSFRDHLGRWIEGIPPEVVECIGEICAAMAENPTSAPQPTENAGGGSVYISSESSSLDGLSESVTYSGNGKLDTGSGVAAQGSAAPALPIVTQKMGPFVYASGRVVRG